MNLFIQLFDLILAQKDLTVLLLEFWQYLTGFQKIVAQQTAILSTDDLNYALIFLDVLISGLTSYDYQNITHLIWVIA